MSHQDASDATKSNAGPTWVEDFWKSCQKGQPGAPSAEPHYKRLLRGGANKDAVLWVHGFNGSSCVTWHTLAPYTHFLLGEEYDFHSFHYPSAFWQKASYHTAATELDVYIRQHLSGYEQIYIIAHSTGGLVAREVILKAADKVDGTVSPVAALKNFACVLNIGVPHHGLSIFASSLATIAPLLFLTFWWAVSLHLHRIFPALQHLSGLGHGEITWAAFLSSQYAWGSALVLASVSLLTLFILPPTLRMILDAFFKSRVYRPLPGLNRIPWQLSWPRRSLKRRDREGLIAMSKAGTINHDLIGSQDDVAPMAERWKLAHTDVRHRTRLLPFGHVKSLQVTNEKAVVVTTLHENIVSARKLRDTIMPLCQTTKAVMDKLNDLLKTPVLLQDGVIKPPAKDEDPRRTIKLPSKSWLGDQQQVADELLRRLLHPATSYQRPIVVSGTAGIGKSSVLRHVAKKLALNREQQLNVTSQPTPVWIPLYRFDIRQAYATKWKDMAPPSAQDASSRAEYQRKLSECILDFFIYGSQIAGQQYTIKNHDKITVSSLRGALAEGAVIILDGVDDWLSLLLGQKPSTTLTDLLAAFRNEFPQSRVVLGVRESRITVCNLDDMDVLEIAAPSLTNILNQLAANPPADNTHNNLATYIKTSWDDPATQLFCTPLIFMTLQTSLRLVTPGWLSSRGLVFENTLHQIFKNAPNFPNLNISITEALDTLMLVGHVMSTRRLASAPLETIRQHCKTVLESILTEVGQIQIVPRLAAAQVAMNAPDAPLDMPLNTNAENLAQRLSDTLDKTLPELSQLLTLSSVFIHIQDGWRPEHREWNDFLASRFLAYAAAMELTSELGHRGSHTRQFFLASDILRDHFPGHIFRPHWVQRIFDHAQQQGLVGETSITSSPGASAPPRPKSEPRAQVAIGNMLGLIGHSTNALHHTAADELLVRTLRNDKNAVTPSTPLVELVSLQNLGFRALTADPGLCLNLFLWLQERYPDAFPPNDSTWWQRLLTFLNDQRPYRKIRNLHAVICANLLEKNLGSLLGKGAPDIYLDDWQLQRVLEDALTHIDDRLAPDAVKRTMQEVFASLMVEAQVNPAKTLSCVTYGLCLVKAYLDGAIDNDSSALRSVLQYYQKNPRSSPSAKKLRQQIDSYESLPELPHIWNQCVRLVEAKKKRHPHHRLFSKK